MGQSAQRRCCQSPLCRSLAGISDAIARSRLAALRSDHRLRNLADAVVRDRAVASLRLHDYQFGVARLWRQRNVSGVRQAPRARASWGEFRGACGFVWNCSDRLLRAGMATPVQPARGDLGLAATAISGGDVPFTGGAFLY